MTSHHRHIDINEGIPFKVLRITRRRCKFGRILKKKQDSENSQVTGAKDESVAAHPKRKRTDTENVCTAWMLVNQVEMYPQYRIADSRNEEELKVALSSLEQSPHWLKNEKLQKYITRWLSVKEKWVKMHRLDLPFDNYNGADLKFELTRTRGQPNLLELVRTLVEERFPVMEAQFLQANASSPSCTPNMLEYTEVFKEKPDTLAQCATASTSSEQCSTSPAKHSAEDVSDLQQPCERSQDYLMSQIKTQTRKIASEVDHMHDSTVLQEVLAILTEAKTIIREDLANSIDIAI
ncbi:hypothetical protein HPB50_003756 [Hyalomma asiaticum]|uniref:Uncharacterized protein n=1 Tax=Hyalomma asiaticum TaxID=266040 RepID=A0ACB7SDT1_HYAAI|nr:hypothetical protein HPB50_003756 [Hyalomma asiaticum]